jgi:hypothetical protein
VERSCNDSGSSPDVPYDRYTIESLLSSCSFASFWKLGPRNLLDRVRQSFWRQMRIAQHHLDVCMSEQFSNRVQVDSRLYEPAGEVMT